VQQPDGTVTLNCALGQLPAETKLKVSNRGITSGWLDTSEKSAVGFSALPSGEYQVLARTTPQRGGGGGRPRYGQGMNCK